MRQTVQRAGAALFVLLATGCADPAAELIGTHELTSMQCDFELGPPGSDQRETTYPELDRALRILEVDAESPEGADFMVSVPHTCLVAAFIDSTSGGVSARLSGSDCVHGDFVGSTDIWSVRGTPVGRLDYDAETRAIDLGIAIEGTSDGTVLEGEPGTVHVELRAAVAWRR